jgi:uncharacterized RDD family membrane protein YckC
VTPQGRAVPGIARRLACALYDLLLAAAIALIATLPFVMLAGDATSGSRRHALQAWLLVVMGAYFVFSWSRTGQTLPMKTWRIQLVRHDGGRVGALQAAHRFVLALLGTLAAGAGFLWAVWDRDHQFLHDRLAGTALVLKDR